MCCCAPVFQSFHPVPNGEWSTVWIGVLVMSLPGVMGSHLWYSGKTVESLISSGLPGPDQYGRSEALQEEVR